MISMIVYLPICIMGMHLKNHYKNWFFMIKRHRNTAQFINIPFFDLYHNHFASVPDNIRLPKRTQYVLKRLSLSDINITLRLLQKFNINLEAALMNPHIFCMNPTSMDNYGEILRECGFPVIQTENIIRYHTLVKSNTIGELKKKGLIDHNFNLEENLFNCFRDWPRQFKTLQNFSDSNTNIVVVRMSVLEKYLRWKLSVTSEEFKNYCDHYKPLKHRPMSDIQEALEIAQNKIKFDSTAIRKNGFLIHADPINTKLIIENIESLAGLDICSAIKKEPAILKNNYQSILRIISLLKEHNISEKAQACALKIFCMKPETVETRLMNLKQLQEYHTFSSHPRVLFMIIHNRTMMSRLDKINDANKQCYTVNTLVAASRVFEDYINKLGERVFSRDIATLVVAALKQGNDDANSACDVTWSDNTRAAKQLMSKLRRHKYYANVSLRVMNENIKFLRARFGVAAIIDNCQLLLYPSNLVRQYVELIEKYKKNLNGDAGQFIYDIEYSTLNDYQMLALILYEIEKQYHFNCNGVWEQSKQAISNL